MEIIVDIEKIKHIREQKGLTKTAVAKALGYRSLVGYHHIESGKNELSANRLLRLANVLGVSVEELTTRVAGKESA